MTLKGTTPVPNVFFDEKMKDLSGSAIRVYLKIARNTFGWRDKEGNIKQRDWISHSQFEKVGLSNRSITNAIEELIKKNLIYVTDYHGNSLTDPQKRKFAKQVFYSINLNSNANTTINKAKKEKTKPQVLRSTKDISLQKYSAENKIPDHIRIGQIKEEEQNKQILRDSWL